MEKKISHYFEKHCTDKINNYSKVYDDLFEHRRYDKINLLEIGIGTLRPTDWNMLFWKDNHESYQQGASLRAFRDYFINGEIYGVDIQSDCMIKEDRIHTFLFDSKDKQMCDHYFSDLTFDIIIDDGDHYYANQIATFEIFFDKLSNNGVYLLEDYLGYPAEITSYFINSPYNFTFRDGLVIIKK